MRHENCNIVRVYSQRTTTIVTTTYLFKQNEIKSFNPNNSGRFIIIVKTD